MSKPELLNQLQEALVGDAGQESVAEIAEQIVAEGIDIQAAIDTASAAIREIGEKFETGEVFLPDLMIAGKKMERCMAVFKPQLEVERRTSTGARIVIGSVMGDIHDIGKNLVATMLSVGGFEVVDLGVGVPAMEFVKAAKKERADIIALSSLMTTTLPYQREVLDLLREMGLREKYFVVVGGGPVTPEFATEIGADGWAENAALAVSLCTTLMTSGKTPPVETVVA
jgi:methylmalonyl-CoA mutase cobalamin-binding domain/chain